MKRAYKRLTILRHLATFDVPKKELVQIYILFIRSVLEQSFVVWGSSITEEESNSLEQGQKCSLRIIYQDKYISYQNALINANLIELPERRKKLSLRFALKCLKNPKTSNMFQLNENYKNTRNCEKFKVPFAYHS